MVLGERNVEACLSAEEIRMFLKATREAPCTLCAS
jgi:hypothetical protein